MNYQREVVYNRRNFSLHEKDISIELNQIIDEYSNDIIEEYCSGSLDSWDKESLQNEILNTFSLDVKLDEINDLKQLKDLIIAGTSKIIEFKKENFDEQMFEQFQRFIILRTIDKEWQDHLYMMDQLREGIGLRAYGQKNPLVEYKHEGFAMFETMMRTTNSETLKRIFRTDLSRLVQTNMQHSPQAKNIQTKNDQNILAKLNAPKPSQESTSSTVPPQFGSGPARPIVPNQKKEPIKVDKKIGRNDKVTIQKGTDTKIIKYKKVQQFINDGWTLID